MNNKAELATLFQTIDKMDITMDRVSYYEELDGVVYCYNDQDRMVMMMPKQDWLDILKFDGYIASERCEKHKDINWGRQTWDGQGWGLCVHCEKSDNK